MTSGVQCFVKRLIIQEYNEILFENIFDAVNELVGLHANVIKEPIINAEFDHRIRITKPDGDNILLYCVRDGLWEIDNHPYYRETHHTATSFLRAICMFVFQSYPNDDILNVLAMLRNNIKSIIKTILRSCVLHDGSLMVVPNAITVVDGTAVLRLRDQTILIEDRDMTSFTIDKYLRLPHVEVDNEMKSKYVNSYSEKVSLFDQIDLLDDIKRLIIIRFVELVLTD
jgi:hypothetical protein